MGEVPADHIYSRWVHNLYKTKLKNEGQLITNNHRLKRRSKCKRMQIGRKLMAMNKEEMGKIQN